jgi:hypothetical protein
LVFQPTIIAARLSQGARRPFGSVRRNSPLPVVGTQRRDFLFEPRFVRDGGRSPRTSTAAPLRDIVEVMLRVNAQAFSLEAGNVRHEHE